MPQNYYKKQMDYHSPPGKDNSFGTKWDKRTVPLSQSWLVSWRWLWQAKVVIILNFHVI